MEGPGDTGTNGRPKRHRRRAGDTSGALVIRQQGGRQDLLCSSYPSFGIQKKEYGWRKKTSVSSKFREYLRENINGSQRSNTDGEKSSYAQTYPFAPSHRGGSGRSWQDQYQVELTLDLTLELTLELTLDLTPDCI